MQLKTDRDKYRNCNSSQGAEADRDKRRLRPILQQRMELRWRNGGKASIELYGEVAVVDRCVAYI